MKKHFLKSILASAAAASLIFTLSGCQEDATDIEEVTSIEEDTSHIAGENKLRLAVNVAECAEDYNKAYEKAYDEAYKTEVREQEESEDFEERRGLAEQGKTRDPYDVAQYLANLDAHAECKELGLCKGLELEPVQNKDYRLWEGTFEVDDINKAAVYLYDTRRPNAIGCVVGDTTAAITYSYAFTGNCKGAAVELTYDDGTTSQYHTEGSDGLLSVSAPQNSGTITKASYELTVFSGNESFTVPYQIIRINLVKKEIPNENA